MPAISTTTWRRFNVKLSSLPDEQGRRWGHESHLHGAGISVGITEETDGATLA
jgi:uncharacterized protein YjeT (DUF2065 family)